MVKKLPGVYIHLPFCSVHCVYCDFPLTTRLSLSPRYYEALFKELRQNPPQTADTLYFGGGTPSLAPIEVLNQVFGLVSLQPGSEVTLEANPDHIKDFVLNQWRESGINRLSLGIQSLEPAILKMMLREHTAEVALQTLLAAKEKQFESINVDLMLGYPNQSPTAFLEDLKQLIDIHPEHFSIYLLELHEKTPLAQMVERGELSPMPEELQLKCLEESILLLKKSGYEHYEVSNFAIPGKESRHNLKYWTDSPYYAYGAGAAAYKNSVRTRNISDVLKYIEAMESGQSPHEEVIQETSDTRARNALIFGLRKTKGINVVEFIETYGVSVEESFRGSMQEFITHGFLEMSQNQLHLTEKGLLVSNEILASAL